MATEKKSNSVPRDEETRVFIKLAREHGMSEKKITECIRHNKESKKRGHSSYEDDLALYFESAISVN